MKGHRDSTLSMDEFQHYQKIVAALIDTGTTVIIPAEVLERKKQTKLTH